MSHPIVEKVRAAGVVGAGGAGFPTHVKLGARADTFLVNGVECEPLLHKDKELMRLQAGRMVEGLRLAMDAVGATRGVWPSSPRPRTPSRPSSPT
jgi:Na+-translocating ferredoxin:NAD+ oxidoreductase RnfC subunit